jgi:hypothetical protein
MPSALEGPGFGQGSPLVRSGTHGVSMSQLIEISVHEASHSVIARVVGLPCGGATVLPANEAHGMAYFDHRDSSLGGILAILAGRIGTQELLGCASDRGNSVMIGKLLMSLLDSAPLPERIRHCWMAAGTCAASIVASSPSWRCSCSREAR